MTASEKLYKFSISGSIRQKGRFWDAVHHYYNYSENRTCIVESSVDDFVFVRESNLVLFESLIKTSGLSCKGIDNAVGLSSLQEFIDFMIGFLRLGDSAGNVDITQTLDKSYIASVKFRTINAAILNHAYFHKPAGVEQTSIREDYGKIIIVFKFQGN